MRTTVTHPSRRRGGALAVVRPRGDEGLRRGYVVAEEVAVDTDADAQVHVRAVAHAEGAGALLGRQQEGHRQPDGAQQHGQLEHERLPRHQAGQHHAGTHGGNSSQRGWVVSCSCSVGSSALPFPPLRQLLTAGQRQGSARLAGGRAAGGVSGAGVS